MNIYKIYPSASATEHEIMTMTELGTPEEALAEARTAPCVECFLETTAWAERVVEA